MKAARNPAKSDEPPKMEIVDDTYLENKRFITAPVDDCVKWPAIGCVVSAIPLVLFSILTDEFTPGTPPSLASLALGACSFLYAAKTVFLFCLNYDDIQADMRKTKEKTSPSNILSSLSTKSVDKLGYNS